ncbi:hypothetical protein RJ641_009344 [Dillenia turbinata]|uniref:Uncharacterized protein n=1 Tax=Dillenia turbinata TaxID=194707 RepID=A0AAN8VC81_9MAGN
MRTNNSQKPVSKELSVRAMAGIPLRLLVVLLGLSHLLCFNAIPLSRTQSLMADTQLADKINMMIGVQSLKEQANTNGRMDVELNDYPGSGANNRHTPKPQLGRGCVDC